MPEMKDSVSTCQMVMASQKTSAASAKAVAACTYCDQVSSLRRS